MNKQSEIILAWHNGERTDADFPKLYSYLSLIPVSYYFIDNRDSYSKYLPAQQYYIEKNKTWKIERKNLNFRIHLKRLSRKTICYSKDEQIHDNVIGMYIERYYFKNGQHGKSAYQPF